MFSFNFLWGGGRADASCIVEALGRGCHRKAYWSKIAMTPA